MSDFLVLYNRKMYANEELYINAVAGGERAFAKMLAKKELTGQLLLDQIIYPLDEEQLEACKKYNPTVQDFDDDYMHLNVLTADAIEQVKENNEPAFPSASVITLAPDAVPEIFKCHRVWFFRVKDFKDGKKYRALPKMASLKVCGRAYIALNAVNIRADAPIIVTAAKR